MKRTIALLIGFGLVIPSLAAGQDEGAVRVAFIRARFDEQGIPHGTLFVKTIGGGEQQITNDDLVNARGPQWSPDGTKIAFGDARIGIKGGVFSIVHIADLTRGTVASTGLRGGVSDMTDEFVTFTSYKGTTTWVGVARLDGSDRVDLAPDSNNSSLSSDGSRVLFITFDTINVINRDGTGRQMILLDPMLDRDTTPYFAGGDRYVVYGAYRGAPGAEELYVFIRHIETGEETNLDHSGLVDVVGDWIVIARGDKGLFAVSLDGRTRFELPWIEYGAVHGDLSTLAPPGEGGGEPRAVYATGKLPTTWAALKTR